jgi:uncharacterized protein YxjI
MFDARQYIIEEKLATLRFVLCVKDVNGTPLGYVKHQRKGLAGLNFLFEDIRGVQLGEVDKKGGLVPSEYEVKDQSGELVGRIRFPQESKWRWPWWMEDAQGKRLFTTGKGDYREHGFPIVAPDGNAIAQVHKKWVTTRDSYSIEILRQDFDPFLILSYVITMHEQARARHQSIFDLSPY